ncbi:MAG: LysM peptidoglycan-binding domain-containing protein [Planctomycetaceae bacterium]
MGLALGLTGTAGTMAYRNYGPALWQGVQTSATQAADAPPAGDAVAGTDADAPPAAPPETLDTDALFDEQPAPVRKASHQVPARSGDSFDNLAEADTDLDAMESSIAAGQSEPADESGPNHSFPGLNRRSKPGPAGRVTTTTLPADELADSPESEFEEAPVQPPRRISALPRAARTVQPVEEPAVDIPSLANDEGDLADDVRPPAQSEPVEESAEPEEEAPRLRFPRRTPVVSEVPAELDDAAPPLRRTPSATVPASLDEPVVDVEDDTVDGYVSVDPRERRALSRIQVMRADNPTGHIADAGEPAGRRGDPERQPITPRGARTAVGPTATRSPRANVYLVEQTDTYWSISKKLYGTSRFFQALAEHNRDRVPQPEQLRAGVELQTPPAEELVEQYARFIPAGGSGTGGPATRDIAREEAGGPPLGVASGTPTRRVPDRAVAEGRGAIDPRELHRDGEDQGFHFGTDGEPLYRVGDGDTLTSIAQQHLGKASRSYELYQLNQSRLADPDRLRVGTVLKLPVDASRIGVVPKGTRVR